MSDRELQAVTQLTKRIEELETRLISASAKRNGENGGVTWKVVATAAAAIVLGLAGAWAKDMTLEVKDIKGSVRAIEINLASHGFLNTHTP